MVRGVHIPDPWILHYPIFVLFTLPHTAQPSPKRFQLAVVDELPRQVLPSVLIRSLRSIRHCSAGCVRLDVEHH